MDQQLRFEQEEETIDLKQLFCYLMRKWKVILALLMVGVLIGAGFGMYKGKNVLQYDAQKAEQFAAYQKSKDNYQQQLNRNAQSVLQQMSPGSVYSSERVFKLSTQEQADEICGRYHAIFEDGATLRELALASSLNCTEEAVAELINVSIEKDFEDQARLQVTVLAPTEESRAALVNALDEKFAALTAELKLTDPSHGFQLISEERHYGYVEDVFLAQLSASKALEYGKELVKQTEGALSAEERAYYAGDPSPETSAKVSLKTIVKWALIVGAVFAVLAVGAYAVYFVFSGSIKSADALRDRYHLYVIGLLASGRKESKTDCLFSGDVLPVNSEEYLHGAAGVLCGENTILSGDMNNAVIAGVMQRMGDKLPSVKVMDRLAAAENALPAMQEADGAILVIQLWKTTDADLQREVEIAHRLQKPIKGVVVIKA